MRTRREFDTKRGDIIVTKVNGPRGRPVAVETKVRRVIKTDDPIDYRRFAICQSVYNSDENKPREWGPGAYVIVDTVTGYAIRNHPISETIRDAEAHFWYIVERMGGPAAFMERIDGEERRIGNIWKELEYGELTRYPYADIASEKELRHA